MIKKYALVLGGVVKNIVLWDEDDKSWSLPEGHAAVVAGDEVGIGWTRVGGVFVAPVVPVVVAAAPTPLEQIRALELAAADDQNKLNRQTALKVALDIACAIPAMATKTRAEVHALYYASNAGYKRAFDVEAQITALRKLIV